MAKFAIARPSAKPAFTTQQYPSNTMAQCVSRSESRWVPCPNHGGRRPSAEFGLPSSNDSAPAYPATGEPTKTGSCRFLPRQLPKHGQNHRVKQQSRYPENAIPENGANQVPTERSGQMLDESPKNTKITTGGFRYCILYPAWQCMPISSKSGNYLYHPQRGWTPAT